MSPTSPVDVAQGRGSAATHAELDVLAERAGVELVDWPQDDRRRSALARAGIPRLLLVDADADTPDDVGLDEDWVRRPADLRDADARLRRLARLVEQRQHDRPVLDPSHIVHFGGTSVVLSSAQASVTRLLLERPGRVVPRDALEAVLWPDGAPGPKALDGVVFRLRRRLTGLGLVVRSTPGRGFAIDACAVSAAHEPGPAPPTEHPTAV
jgi:DNA-binding winged helix-turn-helix (wHTH) protein